MAHQLHKPALTCLLISNKTFCVCAMFCICVCINKSVNHSRQENILFGWYPHPLPTYVGRACNYNLVNLFVYPQTQTHTTICQQIEYPRAHTQCFKSMIILLNMRRVYLQCLYNIMYSTYKSTKRTYSRVIFVSMTLHGM